MWRNTQHFLFVLLLCFAVIIKDAYGETTNIIIILDASASMGERIGSATKMDIAKSSIKKVLQNLPNNVRVGLRVYGHQSPRYLRDCKDSRLEVPLKFTNYQDIVRKLTKIFARGYTPLAYSLKQVKNDFIYPGRNVVICVTDGIETCGGDPCAVAKNLHNSSISLTIHVIGFDVGENDREVLMYIPQNSDGSYFSANNEQELYNVLDNAFELSINPGFVKLEFSGLAKSRDFIYGNIFFPNNLYTYQIATTKTTVPMAPGSYKISNIQIWSIIDPEPYCPVRLTIDYLKIRSGQVTLVPLDSLAILRVKVKLPSDLSNEIPILSFLDNNKNPIIPDHRINSDIRLVLLHPGEYNISCNLSNGERINYENQVFLPQSFHKIEFNFGSGWGFLSWLKILLIFPILYVTNFLSKLIWSRSKLTKIEKFIKFPEKFRGKLVTLELMIIEKDKDPGKNMPFWIYYPIQANIKIFIPYQFKNLINFDTSYKIRVKFRCKTGELEKGNVLMSYKRGSRI